ncbi:MAG: OadG family transporter subunit [Pseudomonadota bacterium]
MLENLELIGTGFAVVMAVLAMIWAACAGIGSVFIRAERIKQARAAEKAAEAASAAIGSPSAIQAGPPPHHLAAITAAVAATLGAGYRISRVAAPAHKVQDWPLEGRIEAFNSRRVRTGWGPVQTGLRSVTPDSRKGQEP